MSRRDLALMFGVCFIWASHFLVAKTALAFTPALFYGAMRMGLVALLLAPLLQFHGGRMRLVLTAGLCLGFVNFALFFTGLQLTSASSAAIAIQLSVPFATILSFLFLGEDIGWRRVTGIVLSFAGVTLLSFDPAEARLDIGAVLVGAAAMTEAVGAIAVRKLSGVPPLRVQAWVSFIGATGLLCATLLVETGQVAAMFSNPPVFVGCLLYSSIGASLIAHTTYYRLLQRWPVSEVAPFILLVPVMALIMGVLFMGDRITGLMALGGLMTFIGVAIILRRAAKRAEPDPAMNASEQPQ